MILRILGSKAILDTLDYLESKNIISNEQHGFRSGRSTLSQLLVFFDLVFSGILQGEDTDTIFLDYAKANFSSRN